MRSINQLQEQLQGLKAQEKEHRRSALIQDLRTQQREQELLIDVLKQALQEKAPEFQDSRALVNDFVLKKAVGAPLRFRPKTREELENELQAIGQNFQRTVEKLKQDNQRNASAKEEKPDETEEEDDEAKEEKEVATSPNNHDVAADEALYEELEQLRAELASKSVTIHAQADEMAELYADLDKLRVFEDQIVRKKHKIALLREQLERQQAENVELVQEKEDLAEKYLQLQEEAQFLRDINMEDAGAKDEERLQQLELIQNLRSRELELQDELENHQKKWATDRDMMHQRLRLLEKEKILAEEEGARTGAELAKLQKKHDALLQEARELEMAVQEEQDQKLLLASRIEELEAKLAQLEALSQEERENNARATAEKFAELEALVEEKTISVKKADRQLNAAKLLARQAKKEKESLLLRVAKLEADLGARTSASCV
ncbi:Lysosomal thioesterase PPT2-B [Phytophthora cinnamomi]|uniref:Lysosomal thioesterase PPT2-B n=1 Tax=Phytophthora cinnamomi TaxID=4785 RepID=UPI00355ABF8D|nr:Lysosomal thioesterase PPT2-B [Phytophthora cinnamomi]